MELETNILSPSATTVFLLPGEETPECPDPDTTKIKRNVLVPTPNNKLTPLYPGYLLVKPTKQDPTINRISILDASHMYINPEVGDYVVGVVRMRTSEQYIVDINSPVEALLGILDFNGATKRNRPNLQLGSCVFCQVVSTNKYTHTRVTCCTSEKKQWSTGETKLGELKEGTLVYVLSQRRKYLEKVLGLIGKFISFEVAIGNNNVVWINSGKTKNLVVLSNLIENVNKGDIEHLLPHLSELFDK